MLAPHYFSDSNNLEELTKLLIDPNITIKFIQNKYNFSKQRLYQIITAYNLPNKHKVRRNKFKEQYGNPIAYRLDKTLSERKSYFAKRNKIEYIQDATIDDLLIDGKLPTHCPILNIELTYDVKGPRLESTASIDKIDNTKGYIKGNVVIVSMRANRIKNDGTVEDHQKIVDYLRKYNT